MRKSNKPHLIKLSENAEFIYREVTKEKNKFRGYGKRNGWFSEWVSQKIIDEFEDKNLTKEYIRFEIGKRNMEMDRIRRELDAFADLIKPTGGKNERDKI